MKNYIGIDIGGTKTAVSIVQADESEIRLEVRECFASFQTPEPALDKIFSLAQNLAKKAGTNFSEFSAVGISCGGIVDSNRGVLVSTPVLPAWKNIELSEIFASKFGIPAFLRNDANAGALAEWQYGAGRGTRNMAFLTCGTGIGAGLVLNGALYEGANGAAGEFGHIRAERFGGVGCGKCGSYEGFCSGTGIGEIGRLRALELLQKSEKCAFCDSLENLASVSAKSIVNAAEAGDATAIEILKTAGEYLGRGIAIMLDLLNLELVSIGSVFLRAEKFLRPSMERAVAREAFGVAASHCRIEAAKLGEKVGDFAAACAAIYGLSIGK